MSVLTIDEAKNKQKNEAFLKLIKKNPTLPIVPMVDSEIVDEDYGYWLGAFGSAEVGEYALYDDRYFTDREDFVWHFPLQKKDIPKNKLKKTKKTKRNLKNTLTR